MRLLLVIEPGLFQNSMSTLLSGLGCVEICAVVSGEIDTLRAVARLQPDVTLIDGTDQGVGIRLARQIHLLYPKISNLVIVSNFHVARQALAQGAHGALIKGFTSHDMLQTLRALPGFYPENAPKDLPEDAKRP